MNIRRQLGDTLFDVVEGIDAYPAPGMRATSIEVNLPVELALGEVEGETVLLADLPAFVYRTAFDQPPARLHVRWGEGDGE